MGRAASSACLQPSEPCVVVLIACGSLWLSMCIEPVPEPPILLLEVDFPTRVEQDEQALVIWDVKGIDHRSVTHVDIHVSEDRPSLEYRSPGQGYIAKADVERCRQDPKIACAGPRYDYRALLPAFGNDGTHIYYQAHIAWPGGNLTSRVAVALVVPPE